IGKRDIRQVDSVGAPFGDVRRKRRVASPQPHLVTDPPKVDGERSTPAPCAEDGDATHQARAPMRRSVPSQTRARFERCRNTINAAAAAAVSTTGVGVPIAYAIGGNAADASTDPTDMYFVTQAEIRKTARAGGNATGASAANTPHAVATPLPPRKRNQ